MKKIILIAASLTALICLGIALSVRPPSKKSPTTLIVGTAAGYAPFVSIDEKGKLEGFDIDVAQALAQELNMNVEFKDLGSMTPLFMALDQGSIDTILWGLSITQPRLEKVAMIAYQGEPTNAYSLLFWKEIPASIKSIDDMKGMTVCVEPASAQDTVLDDYPAIIKKSVDKVDDALLNIQYGKADAAFVEPTIAQKFQKKYPEIKIVAVPLSEKNRVLGVGAALKKSNSALIKKITDAFESLSKKGILKELENKWNIR